MTVWVAWRKRDPERWRQLGTGTEAECWAAVWKAIAESAAGHYSSCVLKDGEKPGR